MLHNLTFPALPRIPAAVGLSERSLSSEAGTDDSRSRNKQTHPRATGCG